MWIWEEGRILRFWLGVSCSGLLFFYVLCAIIFHFCIRFRDDVYILGWCTNCKVNTREACFDLPRR
jgi:hypothetical protein